MNLYSERKSMVTSIERVPLGTTGIQISPLGLGSNVWGSGSQADPALRPVFEAAIESGINLFDSAEVYNFGGSEKTFGQFLPAYRQQAVITSKFFPYPWRLNKASLKAALQASLERLQIQQLDLYLVHFPWPPLPVETWAEALADVYEAGLVRAVGVSNYNAEQLRRAHTILSGHHIPLACNQVEFSLVKRDAERSGLLALCKELGVTLVAYRPLASGLLSGAYSAGQRPGGLRGRRVNGSALQGARPLVEVLKQVGEAHDGKTPSQVALNWLICKGAVPIPGASKVSHLQQNAGALGWRLSEAEVAALEQASLAG
jgi:aryl-alcohol dehydrogenase-like predicted oxidoreductase